MADTKANAPKAGKKGRKARDPNAAPETKSDKFKRLGTARINKAVSSIVGLRKLCTPSYEWTEEQGNTIVKALRGEIDALENALKGKKESKTNITL